MSLATGNAANGSSTTYGNSANGIVAQSAGGGTATLVSAAPSSTAGGTMQIDICWPPGNLAPTLWGPRL